MKSHPDHKELRLTAPGALIGLPAPAIRILKNWPGFLERLAVHAIKPRVRMMKHDFTHIGDFPLANAEHPSMPMSRPSQLKLLYSYVQKLGIPVRLGGSVTEYFEDENQAGIVYSDGTRETADVVVAADGVGSKAWDLVLGEKQDVISSGFACHLVTFPASPALENPMIREGFGDLDSGVMFNLGPNAHFVIGKTPEMITWCLIHRVSIYTRPGLGAETLIRKRTMPVQMKTGARPLPQSLRCSTFPPGRPSTRKSSKQRPTTTS